MSSKVQIPPRSSEAETAILGCLLVDSTKMIAAIDFIKLPEFFYIEKHRLIWTTMLELYKEKAIIDTITLINKLTKKQLLDSVDGAYYITELLNKSPSAENIEYYCKIIREKYLLRQTILVSTKLRNMAYEHSDAIEDFLARMKISIEEMLEMRPNINSSLADITDETINSIESGENIIFFDNPVIGKILRGITRGGIAAIGARPGNMKTTLSTFIMKEYLAQNPNNVGIMFNLQMTNTEIIKKLIAMESSIKYSKIREAKGWKEFTEQEIKEIKETQKKIKTKYKNFHMFDNIRTLDKILFEISKLRPDLVIIDYIQLVRIEGETVIREIMRKVMEDIEWASKPKNSNFATIMVSQLNREIKDRFDPRPTLTDFKESGAIEEGCETAIMPFFGYSFDSVRFPENQMYEVMLRKNRFGGPSGYLVGWDGEGQRFFKPTVTQADTWMTIRKRNERKGRTVL